MPGTWGPGRVPSQGHSSKRLPKGQTSESPRTPGPMAQAAPTRQKRRCKNLGALARGSQLATGSMPTDSAGFSHSASHSGNHAAGLSQVSARGLIQALFPALEHGTDSAQHQDHPANGSVELQEPAELRARNPDALFGAQSGAQAHAGSHPSPSRAPGASQLRR